MANILLTMKMSNQKVLKELQLSEEDRVVIFIVTNADTITFEAMDMILIQRHRYQSTKFVCGGKNALDFSHPLIWAI